MQYQKAVKTFQLLGLGVLSVGLISLLKPSAVSAQVCNVFGCSQPGAGACNPFGCPNPGAGECNPFGCPASPPSNNNTSNSTQSTSNSSSRRFTINNNTNQAIQALFLSPSSDSGWGSNDINSRLFTNNSVSFNLMGECNWDLRVELSNGQALQQLGIDTCLNNNYSVGGGGSGTGSSTQATQSNQQSISPVSRAGNYWVYSKPNNVSDSQMQRAGAAFYSATQACSMHYSLCTNLSGVWLSQQQSLVIQ